VLRTLEVSPKKARGELSSQLKRVEEEVISQRGRDVARTATLREGPKRLPSLRAFRAEVRISGERQSHYGG
jgi:hypothetical protein